MEIYLDNSATTKPYKEVIDKMVYALDTDYANPSSLHRKGVEVEKNIKNIRQSIARTLGAKDKEIYFTSGGTESNNTIIRGIVALNKKRKNHIISTTIEHPSVLNTLKDLESEGCEVTYLEVDKNGKIDDADRVIDGKRTPDWTGGMVNTFNYKNFDLSVGTSFQLGGRMRNQFYVSYALENNNMNLNNMVKDYWTPENPTNESAQPGNMGTYRSKAGSWGNQKSDVSHTMSSSDFFKITHVSLGYTFDKKLISKSFLTNLRLYCTVQNPMIICADNVIVPEQLPTNVSSTDLMTRNVMFGVNVSF